SHLLINIIVSSSILIIFSVLPSFLAISFKYEYIYLITLNFLFFVVYVLMFSFLELYNKK